MTTTPAPELPPISLEVAILHRGLNQAKRNLAESRELFRTVALDVAHQAEVVERLEAELQAAKERS